MGRRVIRYVELPPRVKHGSGNAYSYYRCRCDVCRKGQGARAREYRLRDPGKFSAQRRAEYKKNPERFKARTRERYRKQRRILARYKVLVGCQRCGYRENSRALEFHHRNPGAKEFNVSMVLAKRKWSSIKDEVRKCDVLCANCHNIVEAEKWDS